MLVTVDTLRADRVHAYGNNDVETPILDELARKGARFVNAVAQVPLTPPSHASIFTGMNPNVHQVRNTGGFQLNPSVPTLTKMLKAQGWDTAAFVGASVLKKSFGFSPGFDLYDDQMPTSADTGEEREFPERRASVVVDHALDWIRARSGKPFFLWVHLYDPHEPYDPPEPFHSKYRSRLYDGEVAYTDQQLGRLLHGVEGKSAPEKTLVVVLGDHGESLGDHGEFNHGVFLYDSTLRIPLIMAGHGIPATVVTQQARTIDVLPTILQLMGGTAPENCQGTSLAPVFKGGTVHTDVSYEETLYPKMNMGWAELRGIRTPKWKYVQAPQPELYDLDADPGETNNVIHSHEAEARQMAVLLKAISRAGDAAAKTVSPSQMDLRTKEQLTSLGYLSGMSSTHLQLNGEGDDPKVHTKTLLAFQRALGPDSKAMTPATKIEILRQALAADKKNPSLYFYLASTYEHAGHYDRAIATCRDASKNGIINGRLLARLGDLSLRKGNKGDAIAAYEQAAQYDSSDVESQTNLGTAYLETGRVAEAERCFRRVLTTEDYASAHNGLGLVAIQKHDASMAQQQFARAVALNPDLVEAQLNLGLLYRMSGDRPHAKECFEAFLAKAPLARYGTIIPQVKEELAAMR